MRRNRKDIYFKKIRALHKAMPFDDDERTRFKKETGFTEKETVKKCLEEFQQDIDAVLAVDSFAASRAEQEK